MKFADMATDLMAGSDMLVTRYMSEWDGRMTYDAIMQVARQEIRDNSKLTTRKDGTGRMRPSLISDCPRKQALSYLGVDHEDPDDGSLALMDDGTQRHYYWQKVGLSAGFLTDIETHIDYQPLRLSGQIDGLMVDGSVFELKTMGPTLYTKALKAKKPTRQHLMQVHGYMKALGTTKASVVYEQRSWNVTWREFRIDFDEEIFDDLVTSIQAALLPVERHDLPPMLTACERLSGPTFKGCEFHQECPSAVAP